MNKEQEEIAEQIIKILKNNSGLLSRSDLKKHLSSNIKERNSIIANQGLKDRKLIKSHGSEGIILKEKGWEFESFNKLRRKKTLETIKENTSFVVNIIFAVLTIYLSVINTNLSESNKDVSVQLTKLRGELSLLDAQIDYHLSQHETIPLDTIKHF